LIVHELGKGTQVVGKEPVISGYQVAAAVYRVVALPLFGRGPGACRDIAAVFVNNFNIFIIVAILGLRNHVFHCLSDVDVIRSDHNP